MASKVYDNFEKETFTVLTPIGIKAIQDFNAADKDGAYIIIKGSTNLKYITPPNLLTENAYYNSNPAIKSCDLDAIMYLQNHHTVASIEPKINLLIDALFNSNFILRRFTDGTEHPGYGVFIVEAILAKYGLSIYLDHDKGKPVLITDVFSGKYPISFMKKNLIKHRPGYIMSHTMRKDDVGFYIFNKATGKLHVNKSNWQIVLSIIELAYILKKDDPLQIDTQLYYTQDALATPIYFQSPEWHAKYGGSEDSATFERVVPIPGIANEGNAAFMSLAYVIHELARGINYGFGPYKTKYDKRDKARVRLNYVLKLIKENQISGLYTTYDKTFRYDNHFADFIDYLYNRYYDPVKNPNGDPMYDFENKKVFIAAGELNGVTRKQILDNVKLDELATPIQNIPEETTLIQFNDEATNPTAKMILKYLTDNNYLDVIKSYTNSSADYATSMLGWYYTGDNAFLTHKLVNNLNLTVKEYHDRLLDVFRHIDTKVFNAQLPNSYTLYKGVNLFNVVTSDGSYLRFNDIDVSKPHYIHNPIPSSTSFKIGVTSRFMSAECCILRINMQKHHKVLILPNVHQVTGMPNEHEVLLPPDAVFEITNVQYKYSKNIIGDGYMKYNLVLVVDCNYLHPDDGDAIPGYKKLVSPPPVAHPPAQPKKISSLFPSPAAASPQAVVPGVPAGKKPSTLFPGKAATPGNPALTGPPKPTASQKQQHSSMSKAGKGGKFGLSGGRVPISKLRKSGSGSRKLFMVTTGSKSKGSRKSSARRVGSLTSVRSSSHTHDAVTYTVIFSDIFGAPCCTSGKADTKDKSAFEILDRVFSHPNAPTSRKLTPELQQMGLFMADTTNHYMDTIREFTAQYPEYEYLMQETNIFKLRETYESVIQLQTELTKTKHGSQITSVRKLTKHAHRKPTGLSNKKNTNSKTKKLNSTNVVFGRRFKLANSPTQLMVAAAGAAG
jgi:hypothetical protein